MLSKMFAFFKSRICESLWNNYLVNQYPLKLVYNQYIEINLDKAVLTGTLSTVEHFEWTQNVGRSK